MLKLIPYKNLERKVFKIILEMGILEDEPKNKYVVQLIMPWGNVYDLNKCKTKEQAKQAFEFYEATLNKGCNISITDSSTAKIYVKRK